MLENLTGQIFGKLTVLQFHHAANRRRYWLCKCECGNMTIVITASLKNGATKSCGHLARQGKYIDLTGQAFGKLIAIKHVGTSKYRKALWLCRCECGSEKIIESNSLRSGSVKTCGFKCKSSRHGHCPKKGCSLTYKTWRSMTKRCKDQISYVTKNIVVCERWKSFENFLADMGERPSINYSLDRINCNKNYFPENCRWATKKEQANNQSKTIKIIFDGEEKSLSQWCEELSLNKQAIYNRLRKGWDVDRALTEPIHPRNRSIC